MDLIGKQLPSVSAADNGKVLGVENGRWRAITRTPATPADMVYIPYSELTYSRIQAALAAGKTPFTKHTVLEEDYTYYLMKFDPSSPRYLFACTNPDPNIPGTFQIHWLQVGTSHKVTATIQFYEKSLVDQLEENLDNNIEEVSDRLALKQLPVTVSGTTAILDLAGTGGVQNTLKRYSRGDNIQFIGTNIQSSPNNILIFTVCGIDTTTSNLHVDLSCVSDGRAYYVRLTPVDTNVMRGTLYSYTLLATK